MYAWEVKCSCSLLFPWLLHVVWWFSIRTCFDKQTRSATSITMLFRWVGFRWYWWCQQWAGGETRSSSVVCVWCTVLNPELTVSCIIWEKSSTGLLSKQQDFQHLNNFNESRISNKYRSARVKKTGRRLVHYLWLFPLLTQTAIAFTEHVELWRTETLGPAPWRHPTRLTLCSWSTQLLFSLLPISGIYLNTEKGEALFD